MTTGYGFCFLSHYLFSPHDLFKNCRLFSTPLQKIAWTQFATPLNFFYIPKCLLHPDTPCKEVYSACKAACIVYINHVHNHALSGLQKLKYRYLTVLRSIRQSNIKNQSSFNALLILQPDFRISPHVIPIHQSASPISSHVTQLLEESRRRGHGPPNLFRVREQSELDSLRAKVRVSGWRRCHLADR